MTENSIRKGGPCTKEKPSLTFEMCGMRVNVRVVRLKEREQGSARCLEQRWLAILINKAVALCQ